MSNTRIALSNYYINKLLDKLIDMTNEPIRIEEQTINIIVRELRDGLHALKSTPSHIQQNTSSVFEVQDAIFSIAAIEEILKLYEQNPEGDLWRKRAVEFFELRARIILNTPICYTLNRTYQLNAICAQLARLCDPAKPNSLLMPGVKQDDIYGNNLDKMLLGKFILTDDKKAFISLVDIVDTVFNRSIESEENIYLTTTEAGEMRALSSLERLRMGMVYEKLESIRRKISEQSYVEWLMKSGETRMQSELIALRNGLRDGDVRHGGTEMNAGSSANEAIVRFREYYESLSDAKRNQMCAIHGAGTTIGELLDTIFRDPAEASHNAGTGVRYCMAIVGGRLDQIITVNKAVLLGIKESKQECLDRLKAELLQSISEQRLVCLPETYHVSLFDQFIALRNMVLINVATKVENTVHANLLNRMINFIASECERFFNNNSINKKLNCYIDLLFAISIEIDGMTMRSPSDNHLVLNEIFKRLTLLASVSTSFLALYQPTSRNNWLVYVQNNPGLQSYPFLIEGKSELGYVSDYLKVYPNENQRIIQTPALIDMRRQVEASRRAQQQEAAKRHAMQQRREASIFGLFYTPENATEPLPAYSAWPLTTRQTVIVATGVVAIAARMLI